jgi:hypothetical protein
VHVARLGSLPMTGLRNAVVEEANMRIYRVVIFCAALLIAGFFTWAVAREHVGAQEVRAIEAAAP